jgi:hypothetical protein
MKLNKKIIIIAAITVVIVLIIASVGIYLFIQNQNKSVTQNQPGQFNQSRVNGANFTNVRGKVSSISGKTAVIDAQNNQGQRIVILSDSTNITKTVDTNRDEVLKVSQNIIITGDKQDDGSINAKNINMFRTGNNDGNSNRPNFQRGTGSGTTMFRQDFGGQGVMNSTTFIGSIESIDGDKVKIKTFLGDELTINIQTDTTFKKQDTGTLDDLKQDSNVNVIGNTDSSGTITARNIMIL